MSPITWTSEVAAPEHRPGMDVTKGSLLLLKRCVWGPPIPGQVILVSEAVLPMWRRPSSINTYSSVIHSQTTDDSHSLFPWEASSLSRAALQRTGLELPTGESKHIITQLVLAESGESHKSAVPVLNRDDELSWSSDLAKREPTRLQVNLSLCVLLFC